jgi:hypothetical protein
MSEQSFFLLLSLLMLGVGPVVYRGFRDHPRVRAAFDSFTLVAVGGIVLGFVLPQLVAVAGGWVMVVALAGLFGPVALERLAGGSREAHRLTLLLGLLALGIHTFLDGMVLAHRGAAGEGIELAVAVALHRLPVGMTIWALIGPRYGLRAAAGVLGLVAAGTVGGFALSEIEMAAMQGTWFAFFQAFVAGSLLHILVHHVTQGHDEAANWKIPELTGAVAGVGVLASLARIHHHAGHAHQLLVEAAGARFLDLALQSAPALVVGYLFAGLAAAFLPPASLAWTRRGSRWEQSARGMLFGLPIPICSCGIVPLYQSLVRRGVPVPAAMAFLVATPELEIGALMLSIPLLGVELTAARLLAAMAVALVVGVLIGRLTPEHDPEDLADDIKPRPESLVGRLRHAVAFGFGDLVDDTAPWIVAGLAIAAVVTTGPPPEWLQAIPANLDVVMFAALGLPMYVCASGATPLAAALILAGASPGAAIAFLLSGPASNVTTLGVISELHGRRIAILFAGSIIGLAVGAGYLINLGLSPTIPTPADAAGHAHAPSWQWIGLAITAVAFAVSLARRGPRNWCRAVLAPGAHHHHPPLSDDGHDHHHDHDHDHHHDDGHHHHHH